MLKSGSAYFIAAEMLRAGGSLDISSAASWTSLLAQVKEFGCSSFSLLFDDIEAEMCPADKQAFSSFAHAQVDVTNAVYRHLGEPATFLFCPTGENRSPSSAVSLIGPPNVTFTLCLCRRVVQLQITAHPFALRLCPNPHTWTRWEKSCSLGLTFCGLVRKQSIYLQVISFRGRKKSNFLPLSCRSKGGVPQNLCGVNRRGIFCPKEGASHLGQHPCKWLWPAEAVPGTLQGKRVKLFLSLLLFCRPNDCLRVSNSGSAHWAHSKTRWGAHQPQLWVPPQLCSHPHTGYMV